MSKTIKGNEYEYYQTAVKKDSNTIIVTTLIGRKDLNPQEFSQKRWSALIKHGNKIKKISVTSKSTSKYHFENKPTEYDSREIEILKFNYLVLLNELRPEELEEFERVLFTRYVYGTTAIEGNTYAEVETDKLLNNGLTSENKTLREATEIANYNEVRDFVNKYRGLISEQLIKNIHSILMKGIKSTDGKSLRTGEYRTTNTKLYGVWFTPSPPDLIEQRMNYLIADYYSGIRNSIHPIELACIFHQKFEEIHPFQDGNGRAGREVLNYMLRSNGFPEIYIPPIERSLYISTMEEGNKSNYVPLIDFILHRVLRSMLYFMTKTGLSIDIYSDEFREFYESAAGEEEYKQFKDMIDSLDKSKVLP